MFLILFHHIWFFSFLAWPLNRDASPCNSSRKKQKRKSKTELGQATSVIHSLLSARLWSFNVTQRMKERVGGG